MAINKQKYSNTLYTQPTPTTTGVKVVLVPAVHTSNELRIVGFLAYSNDTIDQKANIYVNDVLVQAVTISASATTNIAVKADVLFCQKDNAAIPFFNLSKNSTLSIEVPSFTTGKQINYLIQGELYD